jgi:type II restriction/modification system DNA methylase subunit YeeA
MRLALAGLSRYIGTPRVAKHRVVVWLDASVLPNCQIVVIARSDDCAFGVLQSRLHSVWSLALGTSLEDRPRYTPTTTFETFPFPKGLTPDLKSEAYTNAHANEIAAAGAMLNQLREKWLNPLEWVDRVPEVVPGYPDRIVAKPGHEADLKKRTLTNLYNAMPAWLQNAHRELDQAVAAAYGWDDYTPEMPDEEILRRLLDLNRSRSAGQS